MKIKLQDLKEEELGFSGEESSDILELEPGSEITPQGPIRYDIRVCIISEMLIARGRLEAPMVFCCSRCGAHYDLLVKDDDYSMALDLQSHRPQKGSSPVEDPKTQELPEESDRDSVLHYVEKGIEFVDLTPDMRESIILRFPGYPICRDTCKGRCPKCGQNLNSDVCTCEPEPTDDRWGMLDQIEVK